MRGQTEISPNGSIFKPEYSGIRYLFLKCNCDEKIDTFLDKLEDCDSQGMGEWRTKGWESYQTDNQSTWASFNTSKRFPIRVWCEK